VEQGFRARLGELRERQIENPDSLPFAQHLQKDATSGAEAERVAMPAQGGGDLREDRLPRSE
jgi:hypothetical protein